MRDITTSDHHECQIKKTSSIHHEPCTLHPVPNKSFAISSKISDFYTKEHY